MANEKFKEGGASGIGDLARMGGDIEGTLTNQDLKNGGAGFWRDMARMGGAVISVGISGTPVTTGTADVAYAGFTVTASGGTPPYTYALVGTWPAGITVNSTTGAVSGTPTESGTFADLSVSATDADGTVSQIPNFTLEIAAE